MSYALSKQADPNKVFLIQRSELEGRFDPFFYKPEFYNLVKSIKKISYDKLGNIVNFSKETWNQKNLFTDCFPYIEIGEIDTSTGEIKQISHIKIEEAPSRARMIARSGDILISTTRPNRGAITKIANDEQVFVASTGFAVIRNVRDDKVDKNYLFYMVRAFSSLFQMEQRSSGGNYPAITQEELSNILIPIPPKEIQLQIVAKMDAAYLAKKQKEAEAERLLASIDDYLLAELGISLPAEAENTIQNRIFTRYLSDVSGERLDPLYHLENLFKFIENAKFTSDLLSNKVLYMKSGFASGKDDQAKNEGGIIHIRPTNINNDREFTFEKNVYIDNQALDFRKDDIIKYGEVLFNNTNSQVLVGKSIFFNLDRDYFCSNHITRIAVKHDEILPEYLTNILNLYQHKKVFFKICTNWNNQSGVNPEVLKKIKIPLPPLPKQQEIAERITTIRNQAKQLQTEAKAGLEKAKAEIEAIILGDAA